MTEAYWDAMARSYDRSMLLLGGPLPRMADLAAESARGAALVLEVAAGTGLVTRALARTATSVVATDFSAPMVSRLRARVAAEHLANVRCEQADLYHPPWAPASFDVVVAANVLHLVPDLPGALASLARQLKPGGRLVAPTYCHDQTRRARGVSRLLALTGFPGRRRFTLNALRAALESAGLRVTRAELLEGLLPIGFVEARAG